MESSEKDGKSSLAQFMIHGNALEKKKDPRQEEKIVGQGKKGEGVGLI